jgi:hypothetical protein
MGDDAGNGRFRRVHMALSVDVDRFSDAVLRSQYDGILVRADGSRVPWHELRALCAEYRADGYEVFPPCDRTNARGVCEGHEEPS